MRIGWRTDNPPKEEDEYLVQIEDTSMVVGRWTNVSHFWTDRTIWYWRGLPEPYTKVIAWMPLPEPYREEQEHE